MNAMITFKGEERARRYARLRTQQHQGEGTIFVVVQGPDDEAGEWTVMTLRDAIDGEFLYSW